MRGRGFAAWMRETFALRHPSGGALASPSREYLLRPVNPLWIWFTLVVSFLLDLLPWGQASFVPDFLALSLVFWNVHQPRKVGMGAAFVFGLLMDVHNGSLFGQHALAYTILSYGAISLHRRILWFPLGAQTLHVLPLFLLAQVVMLSIRMWVGGVWPGWLWFGDSIAEALLWPLWSWLLLAPQRRPHERDETRPL